MKKIALALGLMSLAAFANAAQIESNMRAFARHELSERAARGFLTSLSFLVPGDRNLVVLDDSQPCSEPPSAFATAHCGSTARILIELPDNLVGDELARVGYSEGLIAVAYFGPSSNVPGSACMGFARDGEVQILRESNGHFARLRVRFRLVDHHARYDQCREFALEGEFPIGRGRSNHKKPTRANSP